MNFLELYNPSWLTEFEHIKQTLHTALQDLHQYIDIQHVGSTAITGLIAKPILDIDIILHNKKLQNEISDRLQKLGYLNRGDQGIPGRFAFRQSSEFTPITATPIKWQSHHLYLCFADSLALKNHLMFRHALMNDPGLVEKYAELKKHLTADDSINREEYSRKKTEFILSVLANAGFKETELQEIRAANNP